MNTLSPESGSITYGSNVTIGYYDQEQVELTSSKRVLDELWDEYPDMPEKRSGHASATSCSAETMS